MIGNLTIAIVSVWQFFSAPEEIQDYLIWTFGSFGGVSREQLPIMLMAIIPGAVLAFAGSKSLNTLLLGENYAQSMGLNIRHSRWLIIGTTSLLAGTITGFCGPIAFVGLAVPHICRVLFDTSDHRILIPSCLTIGALLMLICDIAAQMPGSSTVLPINAITALIGSPFVVWIVMRQKHLTRAF
jgi:iron complex transport system permease protein